MLNNWKVRWPLYRVYVNQMMFINSRMWIWSAAITAWVFMEAKKCNVKISKVEVRLFSKSYHLSICESPSQAVRISFSLFGSLTSGGERGTDIRLSILDITLNSKSCLNRIRHVPWIIIQYLYCIPCISSCIRLKVCCAL